jgi:hypothetical protein
VYKEGDYLKLKYGNQNQKTVMPIKLRATGIFENPLEVDDFNGTEDNILNGIDKYPISQKFVEYIKAEILKLNATSFYSMPKDTRSDDQGLNSNTEHAK